MHVRSLRRTYTNAVFRNSAAPPVFGARREGKPRQRRVKTLQHRVEILRI